MKILFATDGSEYSEKAARFLSKFNFSPSDEIHVLHAINWIPVTTGWESLYEDFRKIKEEVVPHILDATANALKPVKANITTSFREDYPDKAIVETSEESDSDLVVMGARGLRGIGSYIVGSVTKLVALKSTRPVLIIRPPDNETSRSLKILFATDGSASSDATGRVLSSIPFPDNTELTVLHVVTTAFEDIPERFAIEINDRIKNIVAGKREEELLSSEEILDRALKALNDTFANSKKMTRFGDPSIKIPAAADAVEADIIAAGTRGMRGMKGMLGSVSRYIINHSRCSVLIARK